MENKNYRINLERVYQLFPNQELIRPTQIAKAYRMDIRTVYKKFGIDKGQQITRETLARKIS